MKKFLTPPVSEGQVSVYRSLMDSTAKYTRTQIEVPSLKKSGKLFLTWSTITCTNQLGKQHCSVKMCIYRGAKHQRMKVATLTVTPNKLISFWKAEKKLFGILLFMNSRWPGAGMKNV